MEIEEVREYCLSLPLATEDFPFDETTLAFRVMGRIFAMIDLDNISWFVLKCQPDYAIELRDKYNGINPAFHMNKKHWNQVIFKEGDVPDSLTKDLILHSYNQVILKFTGKQKREYELLKNG